jgi:hypothetical protein
VLRTGTAPSTFVYNSPLPLGARAEFAEPTSPSSFYPHEQHRASVNQTLVFFIAQVTWRLNRKKPAPEYSNWFLNSGGEGVEHDHRLTDIPHGDGPKADGTLGWCAPPQTGHRAAQDSEAPQEGHGQDADGLIVAIAHLVGGHYFRHVSVVMAVDCLASLR